MRLEWSPQTCHQNPGSREAQCQQPTGFVLGGLQRVQPGQTPACSDGPLDPDLLAQASLDVPNRARLMRMWDQDGRCSGLPASEWVVQVSRAARRWSAPLDHVDPTRERTLSFTQLQHGFIAANPELRADSLVAQCTRQYLSAVLVCVDPDFMPRTCGTEVEHRCEERVKVRGSRAGKRR